METQKIINLVNDLSNKESKFATKKCYIINSQTANDKCNQNNSIKFDIESIRPSLCGYSNPFILVTGDITAIADNKSCAPFSTSKTEINDVFIDESSPIYIAVPMSNSIEYSYNYSDTSGSLWQFKRDEVSNNNADFTTDNSQSFKYKAAVNR